MKPAQKKTPDRVTDRDLNPYTRPLTVQERIRIAESLFGVLSPNMTLEETKEERLHNL